MGMKGAKPTREAQRNERLAAALRENLKRRKARAKAPAASTGGEPTHPSATGEGIKTPASRHQSATKQN